MISNTKDIWRLESKWSDHDRFGQITTESWQRFPTIFFSISLAPTNIVVSGHTKNYGKTRKPLRRREHFYPFEKRSQKASIKQRKNAK